MTASGPTTSATDPTGETDPTGDPTTNQMTMTSAMTDPETTDEPTTDEPTTDEPTTTGTPGGGAFFRFASMTVRDPHFFGMTLLGCIDITDDVPVGSSVNEQFNEAINTDTDADGFLDLSLMLLFRGDGADQTDGGGGDLDFANGQCSDPVASTSCDIRPNSDLNPATYMSQAAGVCHEPDASHLSSEGYTPAPGTTMGPCFHAGPADVVIVTTSFNLPLGNAEIAATYTGDPATALMTGTLRGFLSTTDAEATPLPMDIMMSTGASNVAGLLPGGLDNCVGHDDTDDAGAGWWFYVDFTALPAEWVGP